jgi:hypothetical protein
MFIVTTKLKKMTVEYNRPRSGQSLVAGGKRTPVGWSVAPGHEAAPVIEPRSGDTACTATRRIMGINGHFNRGLRKGLRPFAYPRLYSFAPDGRSLARYLIN